MSTRIRLNLGGGKSPIKMKRNTIALYVRAADIYEGAKAV